MRIRLSKPTTPEVVRKIKKVWRNKWGKRIIICAAIGMALHVASDANDPRIEDNRPRLATPQEMLYGKWDGIGTLPDGTPFCMVGWPCEESIVGDGR
jgi:hypothetical protein